ncbi:MAG TPA: hypothetical protein PLC97_11480 [Myxococcota bacterium]|nr:hypothetical protein [Myxococcota bacterium]
MPTPEDICDQMAKLTAELVGLSLCDQQNYPVLRDLGQGCREVGIGEPGNFSFVLKE